uniref:Uncharacterized protein n=1 Tax=Meloidogyne enterolobii TaxID=390850 RepID=A0A6V7VQR7_MELEN|nr:unnamed protein product [Meloidogyne enterolobii]
MNIVIIVGLKVMVIITFIIFRKYPHQVIKFAKKCEFAFALSKISKFLRLRRLMHKIFLKK